MHLEIAQIFTQIVSFLIVLWVLKKFAWKPLLSILDERQKKIQDEFDLIEEQKRENAKMLKVYEDKLQNASNEVKLILKEAREAGLKTAKNIEDRAEEQAKQIIVDAQDVLQKQVEDAKLELKNELVKMTLQATEKMMQESMSGEKQKQLVEEFVNQAGQSK